MSSTTGITFGGLASGLDTQAIIAALLAIEQRPITALQAKKAGYQQQLTLFGDLETKLQALQDAADDIKLSSTFLEYQAGLDRTDYLTASASSSAAPGTYTIVVNALAKAQVSQSDPFTSGTTPLIAGTGSDVLQFSIDGGAPISVTMSQETYSLQDIATAINNTSGLGIQATVLQKSATDYRLVLTGQQGTAFDFTVSTTSTSGALQTLAADLSNPAKMAQQASDAQITVNGITVTRSSNQISDAITGVTLSLVSAAGGNSSILTITPDATKTAGKVQKLVDAYNTVVDWFDQQAALDSAGQPTSPLFGDSTIRLIRNTLRGVLGSPATTGNQAYSLLSQVGIDSDRNGKLTFDQGEFGTAVAADPTAVKALFANTTDGIAVRVYDQVDDYLDSVDGVLVARKNGFNQRIQDADDQIQALQRRLAQTQAALEQKFANLEILLGRLQSQGSALGSLGSLTSSASGKGSS